MCERPDASASSRETTRESAQRRAARGEVAGVPVAGGEERKRGNLHETEGARRQSAWGGNGDGERRPSIEAYDFGDVMAVGDTDRGDRMVHSRSPSSRRIVRVPPCRCCSAGSLTFSRPPLLLLLLPLRHPHHHRHPCHVCTWARRSSSRRPVDSSMPFYTILIAPR